MPPDDDDELRAVGARLLHPLYSAASELLWKQTGLRHSHSLISSNLR